MKNLVLHPQAHRQIAMFLQKPSHALLLTGSSGTGKMSLAIAIGGQLLDSKKDLQDHPYASLIKAENNSIGIDSVRQLEKFVSLKIPASQPNRINRLAIIENAHLLTKEAQNALLKTIEEPPNDTLIILTAANPNLLLPTVRSRTQIIDVKKPETHQTQEHFSSQGYNDQKIRQALLMSGGLPGLMRTILGEDSEHELVQAAKTAREILQNDTFGRLLMVDSLHKDREQCANVLSILQQMARLSLSSSRSRQSSRRWERILQASYDALSDLQTNAQPKLVLTNFMLSLV